jgi:hypothetical protein
MSRPGPMYLLETSELARKAERSSEWIRILTRRGAITPVAITGRGVRLYSPDTVTQIKALGEVAR